MICTNTTIKLWRRNISREQISAAEVQRRVKRGERLKKHRERAGLTQAEVAKALDFSPGHYWRIENGVRGIEQQRLLALAGLFNCDVKELDPDVLTPGESELIRVWSYLDADNRNFLLSLAHEVLRLQTGREVSPEVRLRRKQADENQAKPLRRPGH